MMLKLPTKPLPEELAPLFRTLRYHYERDADSILLCLKLSSLSREGILTGKDSYEGQRFIEIALQGCGSLTQYLHGFARIDDIPTVTRRSYRIQWLNALLKEHDDKTL